MSSLVYLLAGIFLPLFPLSMVFNVLYSRIRNPYVRGLMLLLWPQLGLVILFATHAVVPEWLVTWAVLSALLYALRALALRELGLWTSFVGISAWALLWLLVRNGTDSLTLSLYALGFSVPLLLMASLGAGLERRFGAAYLGLYGGLAQSIPRYAGVFVVVVLAVIATPLFPAFFAMLSMIIKALPAAPLVAVGVILIWLLWSWAGARLLQGLIAGPAATSASDLSRATTWVYGVALIGLLIAGVYCSGAIL